MQGHIKTMLLRIPTSSVSRHLLLAVFLLLLLNVRPNVGRAVSNRDVIDLLEFLDDYTLDSTALQSSKPHRSPFVKRTSSTRRHQDTCGCNHGCNFNHPLDCARCCVQVLWACFTNYGNCDKSPYYSFGACDISSHPNYSKNSAFDNQLWWVLWEFQLLHNIVSRLQIIMTLEVYLFWKNVTICSRILWEFNSLTYLSNFRMSFWTDVGE